MNNDAKKILKELLKIQEMYKYNEFCYNQNLITQQEYDFCKTYLSNEKLKTENNIYQIKAS